MSQRLHELIVAEPSPHYRTRHPVVVDCSVVAALLFQEGTRGVAEQAMGGRALHAPHLLDHEIASVALKKHAQGWPAQSIAAALARYADQRIDLHGTDLQGQCGLAQAYGLSAYDAAYLWLAAQLKAPLATFDRKLGEAAQRHLGTLE
jgi:predicted nucleic acid-binding protein